MERLREFIIVEGQADVSRVKAFFAAPVIAVGGLALRPEALAEIEALLAYIPGIILVDPDGPGRRIARRLREQFPALREAVISARGARSQNGCKVGVAYARREALQQALYSAGVSLLWEDEIWHKRDFVFASERQAFCRKHGLPLLGATDLALLCNRIEILEEK